MVALLPLGLLAAHVLEHSIRVGNVSREVEMEVGSRGIVGLGDGMDNSRIYSQRSGPWYDEKILSN